MKKTSYLFIFVVLSLNVMMANLHADERAPIFFNIIHNQEDVGNPCDGDSGFPHWDSFKNNLREELQLLEEMEVVSDQYFSDFIVSVAQYMLLHGDDHATDIFEWFKESGQNLGYHFHPSTWDIFIRTDQIMTLSFDDAVTEYVDLEDDYYDWLGCLAAGYGSLCRFCGTLLPGQLGGVKLMEQYFGGLGKQTVAECGLMRYAPVGRMFRNEYILKRGQEICCSQGAPHALSGSNDSLKKPS
jgi:hypothetical protein